MTLDLSKIPAPKAVKNISYTDILNKLKAKLLEKNPNYIASEGDPIYSNIEASSYIIDFALEEVNLAVAAVLVAHSTGADLDNLGAFFSLTRFTNETDDTFRTRIANRLETIIAGSIEWYKQYLVNLPVTEIDGNQNIIDGTPTPVVSTIKDAYVVGTPDPSYDANADKSETNQPYIGGSLNLYLQSSNWTNPVTNRLTQILPSDRMLQAARNRIAAEGNTLVANSDEETAAELRRFTGDTVYILPAVPLPYVYCATIKVATGLNPYTVLATIQQAARDFVNANELLGNRIPLSELYRTINTDEVTEITLLYPTANITPAKNQVPFVFLENALSLQAYAAWTDAPTFAKASGTGWSFNSNNLYFRVTEDSNDYQFLSYLRTANRITITALDSNQNPEANPLKTYRTSGQLAKQTHSDTYSKTHKSTVAATGDFNLSTITNGTGTLEIGATSSEKTVLAALTVGQQITISGTGITTDGVYEVITGTITQNTNSVSIPIKQVTAIAPALTDGQTGITITIGYDYYEIDLMGTNDATGITDATNYEVKILDSIEITLAE